MSFARILLPVLLILPAVPAPADVLTDLLPPDSKVVFGIRVRSLVFSSVAHTFSAQAQAAAEGWVKTVALEGIDLLRDIDEILIASSEKGPNISPVVVVTGRFDLARLAEGAVRYHGVPILTGETETDNAVAFLDSGIALIGNPSQIHAAIDQRGKNRIDAALNDRITSLRQRYDVWGVGARADGFIPPIPETKAMESIDRFQFGVQVANGLELSAEIHARSAEDAKKLDNVLATMSAIIKAPGASAANSKFDVQAEGAELKLTAYIPDEELKRIIEAETAVLSPVSTSLPLPETQETGPSSTASEAPPVTPAPRAASAPVKTAAVDQATAGCDQGSSKAAPAKTTDHAGDTVILTLPGKK